MIELILMAALSQGVPPHIMVGICYVESAHNPNAIARADGGSDSFGLCQIKLSTARMMGYKGSAAGLMSPHINAKMAAKYLAYQLDRYDGNIYSAITAYNAGRATRPTKYMQKVIKYARYFKPRMQLRADFPPNLFHYV